MEDVFEVLLGKEPHNLSKGFLKQVPQYVFDPNMKSAFDLTRLLKPGMKAFAAHDVNLVVTMNNDGFLINANTMQPFPITQDLLGMSFVLMPEREYVSFEQAIEAFKQGKAIGYHHLDGLTLTLHINDPKTPNHGFNIYDLINGKWSIIG